jgi:predicted O-methyltransferase YrrM
MGQRYGVKIMSDKTIGLDDQLSAYLRSVGMREPEVLQSLRFHNTTYPQGHMQICPEQGQLMGLLVKLLGVQRIIEVGVFTGYSSLAMALALPNEGKIVACDVSVEATDVARQYWQRAGVSHKIDLRIAPALDTLNGLLLSGTEETFDLAFIDADKANYPEYYELCLQLVRSGGVILIDNVLWYGRVADLSVTDKRTTILRELNARIHQDQRVELVMLPIGDGLTLARKL